MGAESERNKMSLLLKIVSRQRIVCLFIDPWGTRPSPSWMPVFLTFWAYALNGLSLFRQNLFLEYDVNDINYGYAFVYTSWFFLCSVSTPCLSLLWNFKRTTFIWKLPLGLDSDLLLLHILFYLMKVILIFYYSVWFSSSIVECGIFCSFGH